MNKQFTNQTIKLINLLVENGREEIAESVLKLYASVYHAEEIGVNIKNMIEETQKSFEEIEVNQYMHKQVIKNKNLPF